MARVEKLDSLYLVFSPADGRHIPFDGRWTFNGDYDKPTFRPSMLKYPDRMGGRSHFFVTDGKIEYLPDCEHEYAGKTVDIPEDVRFGEGDY